MNIEEWIIGFSHPLETEDSATTIPNFSSLINRQKWIL